MDRFEQAFSTGLLVGIEKIARDIITEGRDQSSAGRQAAQAAGGGSGTKSAKPVKAPKKAPSAADLGLLERLKSSVSDAGKSVGDTGKGIKKTLKTMWGRPDAKNTTMRRALMIGAPTAALGLGVAGGAGLAGLLRKKSKAEGE